MTTFTASSWRRIETVACKMGVQYSHVNGTVSLHCAALCDMHGDFADDAEGYAEAVAWLAVARQRQEVDSWARYMVRTPASWGRLITSGPKAGTWTGAVAWRGGFLPGLPLPACTEMPEREYD